MAMTRMMMMMVVIMVIIFAYPGKAQAQNRKTKR